MWKASGPLTHSAPQMSILCGIFKRDIAFQTDPKAICHFVRIGHCLSRHIEKCLRLAFEWDFREIFVASQLSIAKWKTTEEKQQQQHNTFDNLSGCVQRVNKLR